MFGFVRWFLPALVPAVLLAVLVWRGDRNREPPLLVVATFVLGAVFAAGSLYVEHRAAGFTGLDSRASVAGDAGSLLFLFLLVAPMREAAKVAAMWPAFRSRHFDEPYDGVVYAATAALGFASVENALMLRQNPLGAIWIARAILALPAHLFFACTWGYALGRAKQAKRPGAMFPGAWLLATLAHGLYAHLVYGRGSGALVGVPPLLLAMGAVAFALLMILEFALSGLVFGQPASAWLEGFRTTPGAIGLAAQIAFGFVPLIQRSEHRP